MKHTIQEEEKIEFIQSIQKRAMEKYSQATVWNLDGFQGNLGNLLYETIEDTIASQLQSIKTDIEAMDTFRERKNDGAINEPMLSKSGVLSIISNRMGEK